MRLTGDATPRPRHAASRGKVKKPCRDLGQTRISAREYVRGLMFCYFILRYILGKWNATRLTKKDQSA
jgi:hypothetical protein